MRGPTTSLTRGPITRDMPSPSSNMRSPSNNMRSPSTGDMPNPTRGPTIGHTQINPTLGPTIGHTQGGPTINPTRGPTTSRMHGPTISDVHCLMTSDMHGGPRTSDIRSIAPTTGSDLLGLTEMQLPADEAIE